MTWFRTWTSKKTRSAGTALRAEALLMHDAAGVSPALLELIQNEIVQTVSRHMDIQLESVEVRLVRADGGLRLLASLPLRAPGEGPAPRTRSDG